MTKPLIGITYENILKNVVSKRNIRVVNRKGSRVYRKTSVMGAKFIMDAVFEEIRRCISKGYHIYIPKFGNFKLVEARMMKIPTYAKGGKRDWQFIGRRVKFRITRKWFQDMNTDEVKAETRTRYADKIKEDNGYATD